MYYLSTIVHASFVCATTRSDLKSAIKISRQTPQGCECVIVENFPSSLREKTEFGWWNYTFTNMNKQDDLKKISSVEK